MDATEFFEKVLNHFFDKKEIERFENILILNESKMKNLKGFLSISILEGLFEIHSENVNSKTKLITEGKAHQQQVSHHAVSYTTE